MKKTFIFLLSAILALSLCSISAFASAESLPEEAVNSEISEDEPADIQTDVENDTDSIDDEDILSDGMEEAKTTGAENDTLSYGVEEEAMTTGAENDTFSYGVEEEALETGAKTGANIDSSADSHGLLYFSLAVLVCAIAAVASFVIAKQKASVLQMNNGETVIEGNLSRKQTEQLVKEATVAPPESLDAKISNLTK